MGLDIQSDALFDQYRTYCQQTGTEPPIETEAIHYLKGLKTLSVHDLLTAARSKGDVLVQPRCGVGEIAAMTQLLETLSSKGHADILTLTIDAYTRLLQLEKVSDLATNEPDSLNGFPLLSHGWQKTRQMCASFNAPCQVRHGSPDPRLLFAATVASGITSFEGGGLSYNIPYSKDTSIKDSLRYWQEVDTYSGNLAKQNIIVDRELFGTLTAVLIPPCIALAITMIEAILAAREGVKCISIAYPQSGNLSQDVAALNCVSTLARAFLPPDVDCFPVLHQFMGVFPQARHNAEALIVLGSITARLGNATKVINKTYQEAAGIPSSQANVDGILLSKTANSWLYDLLPVPIDQIEEEQAQIYSEVLELLAPILDRDLSHDAISDAFATGELDVPFSANSSLHSAVIPARSSSGGIYISDFGNLPFSEKTKAFHRARLNTERSDATDMAAISRDILYLATETTATAAPQLS